MGMTHLIRKLPNAFQRRTTIDWNIILIEQCNQLLVIRNALADTFNRWIFIVLQRYARTLDLFEHVQCARIRFHTVITVPCEIFKHKCVIGTVSFQINAFASARHRFVIDDGLCWLPRLPWKPWTAQNLWHHTFSMRLTHYTSYFACIFFFIVRIVWSWINADDFFRKRIWVQMKMRIEKINN